MLNNRHIHRLTQQLDEIGSFIASGDERICKVHQNISNWSAAEQLDHTLKVDGSILHRLLEDPEPEAQPKPINLLGRVILTLGWIPRGKAPSPKALRGEPAKCTALSAAAAAVRSQLDNLTQERLNRSALLVPHPRFRGLNTMEALRFAGIHTEHHLKIVREILAR